MSTNSVVVVDLHIPPGPTSTERENKAVAAIARLVGRPRWAPDRWSLKIGDLYRIPDGRHGDEGGCTWVHTHH